MPVRFTRRERVVYLVAGVILIAAGAWLIMAQLGHWAATVGGLLTVLVGLSLLRFGMRRPPV